MDFEAYRLEVERRKKKELEYLKYMRNGRKAN